MASNSVLHSNRNATFVASLLAMTSFAGLLTGCSAADPYLKQLKAEIGAIGVVLTGGSSPLQKPKGQPSGDAAHVTAERARMNAEIFAEMVDVVTLKEATDRAEFGSLVDSLNQGASYEGMYNGLTHSSAYRKLEVSHPGPAAPAALRVFLDELAILEAELPVHSEFTLVDAGPLPLPVDPAGSAGGAPGTSSAGADVEVKDDGQVIEFKKHAPAPSGVPVSAAARAGGPIAPGAPVLGTDRVGVARIFANASFYTLKRQLGDEALRVVAAKSKAGGPALADWYSKWVVRLAGQGVDFGVPLRNKADIAFHRQWALSMPQDTLEWEVLNRMHRVINVAQNPPVKASPSPVSSSSSVSSTTAPAVSGGSVK